MASNAISEPLQLKHPLPPVDGEMKYVAGLPVDYNDTADVISNTNPAFRKFKYFWIDGILFQCLGDGITFRPTSGNGGTGLRALKFAVNDDGSGTPDQKFDGYVAVGSSIIDSRLENVKLILFIINGIVCQDYYPTGVNYVAYTESTGAINFSAAFGETDNTSYIIIVYQPQ